jgi:S-adenosyl methyltransferase
MPEMPPEINASEPHPARIYDYFLGGKNHYAADWKVADKVLAGAPSLPAQARDSGDFARLAFAGLNLVPPGVVLVSKWRPDSDAPRPTPAELSLYGGVGQKP